MNRKTLFRIITISVPLAAVIYFAIGFIFYHFALNANATQTRAIGEKQYVMSPAIDPEREEQERAKDRAFLEKIPEEFAITSHDGLKLKGYAHTQAKPTNNWVFAVHGYTGSARQMTRWNRQLYELGYNVFAPDLRGHGESAGNYYGMGWLDQKDLHEWLELLIENHPDANITLYGVSMGASAVLNLASTELPPQVDSVIADSGFTSVATIFETQIQSILKLPAAPILNPANTVSQLRIGLDIYEASTVELVPNIQVPVFYIHGGKDTFVPVENVHELADATEAPHDVWILDEANHGDAVKVAPDEYRAKVDQFIKEQRRHD